MHHLSVQHITVTWALYGLVKTFQRYDAKASTPSVACVYRTRFWWDLAAWVPFDYIALLVLGDFHAGSSIVARVPLLRLTRLVSGQFCRA